MDAYGQRLTFMHGGGGVAYTNGLIDASGEKVAWAMQVPVALTCSRIVLRYGARTGTPPTYLTGLQSLDSSGNPDGTYLGGGSPASVTFTPPADASWNGLAQEFTLANAIALTKGQWIAGVVEYSSGTINGSNCSSFTFGSTTLRWGQTATIPWAMENTGSWADRASEFPFFAIGDGTNYYGCPAQTINQPSINTSGNRGALRFIVPTSMGSTFKIRGLRFYGRQAMTGGSIKIGVWQGTTAMQSDTYDSDYKGSSGTDNDFCEYLFTAPVALNCGTAYYAGIENASGTSTLLLNNVQVATAAHRTAWPGGSEWYYSTYNGSAWTDDTFRRPLIDLILDDVTPAGIARPLVQLSDLNIW